MYPDRRLTRPTAIASILLVTGLVVTGCSSGAKTEASASGGTTSAPSSPGSSAATASVTPKGTTAACDVVSDEVVRAVLGVDIVRREGHSTTQGDSTTQGASTGVGCIKGLARSSDPSHFTFVNAAVYDAAGQGGTFLDQAVTKMKATPVPGLGDRAVFASSAGLVLVIKGSDVLQAQVTKAGKPGTLQECTAVAKDMLGRLG